jgi:small subunit ribosomal protein S6
MRHYEIVFLVHPDQSEQVPAMIDRYKEMVTSGNGTVHRVEDWGRRRLAYMINNIHKAHYAMVNIECGLDVLAEIERNFKFNDSILRHLVVRRKVAVTEDSAMAIAKAREDAADAVRDTRPERTAPAASTDTKPSEAPATETSATEVPATEAPATEAPATEAPATEAPEAEKSESPSKEETVTEEVAEEKES